ncbi:hypothetical protein [Paucisalibacillus sp. EB02]|uniref:hypothetical protein n=1 Tax=Paucisalibacillus sp. EB02 TaxID=1347087 RepID=UPI0004AFD965|nr:hypothetical protein [Paucisalibacillus sp. EB02]
MQLIHKNEHFYINNGNVVNEIFTKINEIIEKEKLVFSHLIIDGVEVYENHEEYIKEYLENIEKIEITTRNINEMIWETMESIHSYLLRAIPALTELVDVGYENFSKKSWDGINQLAEGMQWILHFMEFARSAPQQPANWVEIEKSLELCEISFTQLLEAVKDQDTVLISDILSYEITPAYESLKKNMAMSLNDEEYLKNVN